MNSLQRLSAAAVLTLVCTLPTLAGEISTGVGVSPSPPPTTSVTSQGDLHFPVASPGAVDGEPAADPLAEVMLGLLRGLLTLL